MSTETSKVRYELENGFCYVRNLEEKGGVISALIPERKEKKVKEVLDNAGNKTFSEIWKELIHVKGVRFEYRSN